MSGVSTDPIDIQKYKCVPLDLLKNVSRNDQVQFVATDRSISLKDFKKEQTESENRQGALSGKPMDAETIENFLLGIAIFFFAIFSLVVLFYGALNVRTYGWKAFQLPEMFRNLPIMALSSLVFGTIGFVIGYFLPR